MEADRQTVLIVDDDAAVGQTLAAQLEQWEPGGDVLDRNRFEAVHVDSGERALEYLGDGFADVVIADLRMPGMDARTRERLKQFYTTKPGGSGLGLAFARKVAESHGGELRIESQPGQGTTVTIALAAR